MDDYNNLNFLYKLYYSFMCYLFEKDCIEEDKVGELLKGAFNNSMNAHFDRDQWWDMITGPPEKVPRAVGTMRVLATGGYKKSRKKVIKKSRKKVIKKTN